MLSTIFESYEPWSLKLWWGSRLVWLRCYGLSLHFYNKTCLAKLVSSFWKLVIIDEESIALLKTTYTRVLVEVSIFQDILFCERVHINEEIMVVRFVKEGWTVDENMGCHHRRIKDKASHISSMADWEVLDKLELFSDGCEIQMGWL